MKNMSLKHFRYIWKYGNWPVVILRISVAFYKYRSSVIRQKGESQNGCFKKAKHTKISEKINISYLLIHKSVYAYQWVRNVCFSKILACFAFFKHPFRDSPFCLILDETQVLYLQFLRRMEN